MGKIPILLLAAGASVRMGQPKSLLQWGDMNLIQHQISKLLKLHEPIYVVLGAYAKDSISTINELNINAIVNPHWQNGMGSSISFGINEIVNNEPDAEAVLIVLVDQPLITIDHLRRLIATFKLKQYRCVVSESENGWKGVPVIFDKYYFAELMDLNGEQGAKKLFDLDNPNTTSLQANDPLLDMDTMEDYERLYRLYLQ